MKTRHLLTPALLALMVSSSIQAQALAVKRLNDMAVRAIGRIGQVWDKDDRYHAFREKLAKDFKDTPDEEAFMKNETWVSILASSSPFYPGVFSGHASNGPIPKMGDIVEMTIHKAGDAKSYADLNEVTKVLCSVGTPEYEDCAKANPIKTYTATGAEITGTEFPR